MAKNTSINVPTVRQSLDRAKAVLANGNLNKFLGIVDVSHSGYYKWLSQGYVSPAKAIDIVELCRRAGDESVQADHLSPPEARESQICRAG